MAGYGGQTIALDALTPSQLQEQAAQASLASTQSQLAHQSLPDELALRRAQAENAQQVNQSGALKLEQETAEWGIRKAMADQVAQHTAMNKSSLAAGSAASSPLDSSQGDGTPQAAPQTPLFSPQVDQVMHSINPDDPEAAQKWDSQMSALAKTDPSAGQFVGKYSESNLNNWLTQIGSNTVAQAGKGATSPLAPPQAAASPLATPVQGGDPVLPGQKQGIISPLTGAEDPELTQYATLFPAQAGAYVKQMGMLKYIQSGANGNKPDINILRQYDPDEYGKLVLAQKNLTDAQKTALDTKSAEIGSKAAGFLVVARQFGVNSPQARGAWTRAITDAANDGMMQPQIAQQWLAHGPDVGFATESMIRAQTVSQAMKSSGMEAANEQQAKINNPEPKYEKMNVYDGQGRVIGQKLVDVSTRGGGQSSAGGVSGGDSGQFDPRAFFKSFTLPHEGGFAAHDANGAPVNMGVNQAANPGVDVRNLTPEQAADIFVKKYATGTESMSPALGGVYADTAYINPARAAEFLKASGGDPNKFLAMRQSWMANLVASNPDKYGPYQKAWANRNRDLGQYIAQQGVGASSQTGGPRVVMDTTGQGGGGASEITPGDISTVPQQMRATVQAIAEGRSAPPRPGSRNGEALLDAVTAYDPTFDAANATSRVKTRVDFTSGKSAQTVNALNTAMGHLLHLDDQAHDLGNFSTAPGILNPIYNTIREKVGNNTALPAFDQSKQGAASEMRKVFAGASGGSEKELDAWEAQLSSSKSYEQLHEVIKNGVTLMGSRLSALQDQYATGMGRSDQIPQMIKPSVIRSVKDRFGVDLGSGAASAQSGPVRVSSPQQAAALPSGTLFQTTDGRVLRRR